MGDAGKVKDDAAERGKVGDKKVESGGVLDDEVIGFVVAVVEEKRRGRFRQSQHAR